MLQNASLADLTDVRRNAGFITQINARFARISDISIIYFGAELFNAELLDTG